MQASLVATRGLLKPLSIAGWAAALAAGAATSLLWNRTLDDASVDRPAWMTQTTAASATAAMECYRREAAWQGYAYCASPLEDVVEVVWASCFGEEKDLLLYSVDDSKDDSLAMNYLLDLENGMRGEIEKLARKAQSESERCSR